MKKLTEDHTIVFPKMEISYGLDREVVLQERVITISQHANVLGFESIRDVIRYINDRDYFVNRSLIMIEGEVYGPKEDGDSMVFITTLQRIFSPIEFLGVGGDEFEFFEMRRDSHLIPHWEFDLRTGLVLAEWMQRAERH